MFFPSPGQVVSGIGNAIQGAENFVSGALNSAVDAVQDFTDEPTGAAQVTTPGSTAVATLDGVVSRDDFDALCRKIAAAFKAVKEDIASIRAYGADGESGFYGDQGGGSGMDPLMMILLLGGTSGTSTLTSNPLLLLLLMGGGGNGGGFDIATALALGLV